MTRRRFARQAPLLIQDSLTLKKLCDDIHQVPFLCLDTEFMREKTYWPEFCLAQMALPLSFKAPDDWIRWGLTSHQTPSHQANMNPSSTAGVQAKPITAQYAFLIDPKAKNLDLTPFYDLLNNPKILKIFHAGRQDLELFYHYAGAVPAPIFDTQLAASVCGYGEQVSYDNLAQTVTGKQLDKSARLTDWAHRPLQEKAMIYALDDVYYLECLYQKLTQELATNQREDWLDEDLAILQDKTTYEINPNDAWLRLKKPKGSPKFLLLLRQLAAWREVIAKEHNLARGRVINDRSLIDIAAAAPTNSEELALVRSLSHGFVKSDYAKMILSEINKALDIDIKQWPQQKQVKKLSQQQKSAIELLKLLLKLKANEAGIAPRLIATAQEIEEFALFDFQQDKQLSYKGRLLSSYRYRLFGADALKLIKGQLRIGLDENGDIIYEDLKTE